MTLNLPQKITIDTGIDALSHGIEAFTTVKANVISDMFSSTCIQLTANYLRTAYGQGSKNPEARYNMAIASAFGFAFSISDLGLIHGLANPISLITHISHGEALAVIMPSVMEFNLIANIPKYAQIARLMGENTENLTLREQAQLSVKAVRTLIADIGLPRRLSDIGIKKEDIPGLADYVFDRQQHLIDPNPRIVSKNEVTSIYESAL
jgi:alcohol dehydrogenase